MSVIREFAPAKINLALHITGRRADGYHVLDSLVAFANIGDELTLRPSDDVSLSIDGPMASGLSSDGDNLVLRAASLMGHTGRFQLTKNLPVASGIGGGSSDGAAALRAISLQQSCAIPSDLPLALGADVPICLYAKAARMQGIGDKISPVDLPPLPAILVNPGVSVATRSVFEGMRSRDHSALPDLPNSADPTDWIAYLGRTRNDMLASAMSLEPVIGDVLSAIKESGAELAQMSGSGATCFGLYRSLDDAARAVKQVQIVHPDWWVVSTTLR